MKNCFSNGLLVADWVSLLLVVGSDSFCFLTSHCRSQRQSAH